MASDADDFSQMTLWDRVRSSNWRARVNGFEELAKLFKQSPEEKGGVFKEFAGQMGEFLLDKNASAVLSAMDAASVFFDRADASVSHGVVRAACGAVVKTAFMGRPVAKGKGVELCRLCVEIEAADEVVAALVDGLGSKTAKLAAICLGVLAELVRDFGTRVIAPRLLVKELPPLFDKTDDGIRKEAQSLAVELYRWGLGPVLSTQLAEIRPAQLKALQARYEEVDAQIQEGGKPVATRYIRSQDPAFGGAAVVTSGQGQEKVRGGGAAREEQEEEQEDASADPYFFADPVAFLPQADQYWYGKLADKKWTERRDALDDLLKWTGKPRLVPGNCAELCKTLKAVIDGDANQIVVRKAVQVLCNLVNGLRADFAKEARGCLVNLLNKYKDKKADIVAAVGEVLDACLQRQLFTVVDVHKEVAAALESKVPSIRHQTILWLHHIILSSSRDALSHCVKLIAGWLVDLGLNDTASEVRDSSAEAFAQLINRVGERTLAPFFERLDQVKQKKVKQHLSAAPAVAKPAAATELPVPQPPSRLSRIPSHATSPRSKPSSTTTTTSSTAKTVRPQPVKAKISTPVKSTAEPSGPAVISIDDVILFDAEDAAPRLADVGIEQALLDALGSAKDIPSRAQAVKQLGAAIQRVVDADGSLSSETAELLLALLSGRPGWKESSDVRILEPMMTTATLVLLSTASPQPQLMFYLLDPLLQKMTNSKLDRPISECLFALAEVFSPLAVFTQIFPRCPPSSNFKILVGSTQWIAQCILEFGAPALTKTTKLIEHLRGLLASSNNFVRDAAVTALCCLGRGISPTFHSMLLQDVKPPALVNRLEKALQDSASQKLPAAIRFIRGQQPNSQSQQRSGRGSVLSTPNSSSSSSSSSSFSSFSSFSSSSAPSAPLAETSTRRFMKLVKTENIVANIADNNLGPCRAAGKRLEALLLMPEFHSLEASECLTDTNALLEKIRERLLLAPAATSTASLIPIFLQDLVLLGKVLHPKLPNHLTLVFQPSFLFVGDANKTVATIASDCLEVWTSFPGFSFAAHVLPILGQALPSSLKPAQLQWITAEPHLPPCLGNAPAELFNPLLKPALDCILSDSKETQKAGEQLLELVLRAIDFDVLKQQYKTYTKAASQKLLPVITAVRKNLARSAATACSAPAATPRQAEPFALDKAVRAQQFAQGSPLCPTGRWPPSSQAPNDGFVQSLSESLRSILPASTFSLMFSREPEGRVRALDLVAGLSGDAEGFLPHSDLLFLWLMANLFSSTESIRLTALDKVMAIMKHFEREKQALSDIDFASFFPYLLLRSEGDIPPLTAALAAMVRPICAIHPRSKVFSAIVASLKAHLSGPRQECHVGLLCELLQRHGISVIQDLGDCYMTLAALLPGAAPTVSRKVLGFFSLAHSLSVDPDASFWTFLHNLIPKSQLDALVAHLAPSVPSTPPPAGRSGRITPQSTPFSSSLSTISPSKGGGSPTNPRSLAQWVGQLQDIDEDTSGLIETMKHVCMALDSVDNEVLVRPHVDGLVLGLDQQLLQALAGNAAPNPRFCKYLVNTLIYVFRRPALGEAVSPKVLKALVAHSLEHLSRVVFDAFVDGDYLRKAFNMLILKLLEHANLTSVLVVLIELLSANVAEADGEEQEDTLFADLTMKCMLTISNGLATSLPRIDNLASVLLAIHQFLCDHPPSKWRNATGTKMPLKTIRALLNEIVRLRGADIGRDMYMIPAETGSSVPILRSYIDTMLGKSVDTPTTSASTSTSTSAAMVAPPHTPHTSSSRTSSFALQTPAPSLVTPSLVSPSSISPSSISPDATSPNSVSISRSEKQRLLRERSQQLLAKPPATPAARPPAASITGSPETPASPPSPTASPIVVIPPSRSENMLASNVDRAKLDQLRAQLQAAKDKLAQISPASSDPEPRPHSLSRWADLHHGLSLPSGPSPRPISDLSHSLARLKASLPR